MLFTAATSALVALSTPLCLYWLWRLIGMIRLPEPAFDALLVQDLAMARRLGLWR